MTYPNVLVLISTKLSYNERLIIESRVALILTLIIIGKIILFKVIFTFYY